MSTNQNQDIETGIEKTQVKLGGPLLAVLVAVGAALAGVVAFTVTKSFVGPDKLSPCAEAQQEIMNLKVQKPNPDDLTTVDDRILGAAADKLHANCIYNAVMDFETTEVFPWLGVNPQVDPNAPVNTTAPTDGTVPAGQDQVPPTSVG
jgi:hypothetical protein